jgi:hypothetical protein
MPWLLLIILLAVLGVLFVLASRPGRAKYIPRIDFGGRQGADRNVLRALEDDVTDLAGVHPPKDPAP